MTQETIFNSIFVTFFSDQTKKTKEIASSNGINSASKLKNVDNSLLIK